MVCSGCDPECTKLHAGSSVLVSLEPGRSMTGGFGTLGLLFEITLALLFSFGLGECNRAVGGAKVVWEACGSTGN